MAASKWCMDIMYTNSYLIMETESKLKTDIQDTHVASQVGRPHTHACSNVSAELETGCDQI